MNSADQFSKIKYRTGQNGGQGTGKKIAREIRKKTNINMGLKIRNIVKDFLQIFQLWTNQ